MTHVPRYSLYSALLVALSLAILAGLMGCKARAAQNDAAAPGSSPSIEPEMILQAYEVPTEQTEQIAAVLHNVFAGLKEPAVARATASPDGQLLVVGTQGIQKGVAAILSRMEGRPLPPPPPTVDMSYWFVVAEPAGETVIGPGLQDIAPALEAVARAQGPLRFDKLETARIRSLSDEQGEANGRYTVITQRASVSGDKIIADVEFMVRGGPRLKTRLSMRPDQAMVLGETGFNGEAVQWATQVAKAPLTLFHVVRATTSDAD